LIGWIQIQEGNNDQKKSEEMNFFKVLDVLLLFGRPSWRKFGQKNKKEFFCQLYIFTVFGHQIPGSGSALTQKRWIRIRVRVETKADPQHRKKILQKLKSSFKPKVQGCSILFPSI
jgi:hypothetical protein